MMKNDIKILLANINSPEAAEAYKRLSGEPTADNLYTLISNGEVLDWLVREGFLLP